MSTIEIPTYVPALPLPAPITSGSGIQTYTDPYGDLWVAANGVRGGVWYRAKDVLYGRIYRNAAYTYATSGTVLPWSGTSRDIYGLYVSAQNGFVLPVAGVWSYHCMLCVTFTAINQFIALSVNPAAMRTNVYNGTTATTNQYVQAHDVWTFNAGDVVQANVYCNAALVMAGLTPSDCFMTVKYEGTA